MALIIRAVLVLIVLVTASDPAGAFIREELICPVRKDWSGDLVSKIWLGGADECPCQKGWKPTPEQREHILTAHRAWHEQEGLKSPTDLGRANMCNADLRGANLQDADLRGINLYNANLEGANLQEAKLGSADLQKANLRDADLQRADFQLAGLKGASLMSANLQGANLSAAHLQGALLYAANLRDADLSVAELQEADLSRANLREADLSRAKLQGAELKRASFRNANLQGANLQGASLYRTNLQGANLVETDVESARLASSDLTGARYSPASPPPDGHLEGIKGLTTVSFPPGGQSGLVQLRELIRKAGLRGLEREATFAIEHGKARQARCALLEFEVSSSRKCLRETPLITQFGGWLRLVFFEWTTGWGLYPERALLIILVLIVGMTFVYVVPIMTSPVVGSDRAGIFRIWPRERLVPRRAGMAAADDIQVDRLTAGIPAAFAWALYFSLISAFHIGWRELNVGTWISRLQPTEFALRGRGWVRIVSGVQSLISVYLVAMWVLTYFGRPFQ